MKGDKVWTEDEDNVVRSLYPDYRAIGKALPHRTYNAYKYRARALGIVTPKPPFTARQVSVVKKIFPTAQRDELLSLFPGRSWNSIKKLAARHGIYRARKPLTPHADLPGFAEFLNTMVQERPNPTKQ